MQRPVLRSLLERRADQNWKAASLLFALIACVHFTAALLNSFALNLFGMMLYGLIALTLVRRSSWAEIRIRRPTASMYILLTTPLMVLIVLVMYEILFYAVDFTSANYLGIIAKIQLHFGAITKYNAWQYFPIAAIGFTTISPFTEEFFFRGLLLTSFEKRFSSFSANLLQAFLFALVHLAYYSLIGFNPWIVVSFLAIPVPLLFGWIVQKTDSLLSSIILHGAHNFTAILLVYALVIPAIG